MPGIVLFRTQMSAGDIQGARQTLAGLEDATGRPEADYVLAVAQGEPQRAAELVAASTSLDSLDVRFQYYTERLLIVYRQQANNLSIAHLLEGDPMQAYLALEHLPKTHSEAFFNSRPLVINLATVLELVQCQNAPTSDRWTKMTLLAEGAAHASDGFPPQSFKVA
jgi:hypothetical protein